MQRIKNYILFVLFMLSFSIADSLGQTETKDFYLKDGTIIQGKIVAQDESIIVVDTQYGTLEIQKSNIVKQELAKQLPLNPPQKEIQTIFMKDGTRIKGIITFENEDSLSIETDYGLMNIPKSSMKQIKTKNISNNEKELQIGVDNRVKQTNKIIVDQTKSNIGINAGLVIPTGDLADDNKLGYNFGIIGRIATKSPTIMVAGGISYLILPSIKTGTESLYGGALIIEHSDKDLFSIFLGPQFGTEKGAYFLPALTGNFSGKAFRLGLDLGGGALFPIGNGKTKVDLGAKFSITNILGIIDENEKTSSIIRINIGLVF